MEGKEKGHLQIEDAYSDGSKTESATKVHVSYHNILAYGSLVQ